MRVISKRIISSFFLLFYIALLLQVTTICNAQSNVTSVQINACVLDANSNLLTTGPGVFNGITECGIARYTTSGILDSTFGNGGYTLTSFGSRIETQAIAEQPTNGYIVAAGFAIVNGITQIALVRYTTTGSLDTNFGTAGVVTTQIGDGSTANAVAIQSNGQIVIAGVSVYLGTPEFIVARYNSTDGSLDTSFNSSGTTPGIVTTPIGVRASANSLAIQSDGKIVVAGMVANGTQNQFCIVRYNADGSYDTNFGTQGIVTTSIGTYAQALSLAIQSNGNIVVAGSSDTSIALARYNSADGSLDTNFNSSGSTPGIVTTSLGNKACANSVVIDSSGNIVIGGFSDTNLLVGRYTSSGVLDTSFGLNATGFVTFSIEETNVCNEVVLQNSDIIAAGYANADVLILRFTSAGLIDTTWGSNGIIDQPGNPNLFTTIWEQESTGTNGGTFTSGAWQTRILNSITNINNTVALSNNQFTLSPGIYTIAATAPAYKVDNHQIRLQNITNSVTTLMGTSAFSPNSGGSMTSSYINGQFAVSIPMVFEIQHMCTTTEANDGLGIASGFGNEIYTIVKITNNFSF